MIDDVTGATLAAGFASNIHRDFSAVTHFKPTTTNPVRLHVEVTPGEGQTVNVDLDAAVILPSFDYGIIASNSSLGGLPGSGNLPDSVKSVYKNASDFTVKNGRIEHGPGGGFGSSPFQFRSLEGGFTVDNITSTVVGMDGPSIQATHAAGPIVVRNSTFEQDMQNISDRFRLFASLDFQGIRGETLIENNQVLGKGQVGIKITTSFRGPFQIRNNEIRHESIVTNGYGILVVGIPNFEISNNQVVSTNGRGIMIDGWSDAATTDGDVFGNYVEIQEAGNREFGTELEATALRVRRRSGGPHQSINVHDNTFIANTGSWMANSAYGIRVSYTNTDPLLDTGIVFERNVVKAFTEHSAKQAKAFVLDGIPEGINPTVRDNIFESNHIALQIGDRDHPSIGSHQVDLISNTVRKAGPEIEGVDFRGISAGWWKNEISDMELIDTRFENGAPPVIRWDGHGEKELRTGGLLELIVQDASGAGIPQANVQVVDASGGLVFESQTDGTGQIAPAPVATTQYRRVGDPPTESTTTALGPHQLRISKTGFASATFALPDLSDQLNQITVNLSDNTIVTNGALSGQVFDDDDVSGTKNGDEQGISGWTVFLDEDNDGLWDEGEIRTYTNSQGEFQLRYLMPGPHRVRIIRPQGWIVTTESGEGQAIQVSGGGESTVEIGVRHEFTLGEEKIEFHGSRGDDSVSFALDGDNYLVTLNNRGYSFPLSSAQHVFFEDAAGTDTIHLAGRAGAVDTARVRTNSIDMAGSEYLVSAANFEQIIVSGDPQDNDVGYLFDSPGDDQFVGDDRFARLTGIGFVNELNDFSRVFVIAQAGGHDAAMLSDSEGDDTFIKQQDRAVLFGLDADYSRHLQGFDDVSAVSEKGGRDRAYLHGTDGSDVVLHQTDSVVMRDLSGLTNVEIAGFRDVTFDGKGGFDQAFFHDSEGDDQYVGRNDFGYLTSNRGTSSVTQFESVHLRSSLGGDDTVDVDALDYLLMTIGSWKSV